MTFYSSTKRSLVADRIQGAFVTNPDPNIGTAVIPFLYLTYGFYDICWTVLPNLCECLLPEIARSF